MSDTIYAVPLTKMLYALIPALIVLVIFFKWQLGVGRIFYGLARMLTQLLMVGYLLIYLFGSESYWLVLGVLSVMLVVSSWIAISSIEDRRKEGLIVALLSIVVGGVFTLVIISGLTLDLEPWYSPRYLIPLAGMIFANCMNGISLASERFSSELKQNQPFVSARNTAYKASLIPTINSLFAVGLVSLPGMMTGQILSGVSPLIAVRYQIVVMLMIFGSVGISSACFLTLYWRQVNK